MGGVVGGGLWGEGFFEVLEGLGGDGFGVGGVVEDFDGDVAGVLGFFEGGGDGFEFDVAEAGAAEVGIVGVEVGGVGGGRGDDFGDGFFFVAHGLDVEVEATGGVIDALDEFDGFGGGGEEVGFFAGEGFHGDGDAVVAGGLGGLAEDGGGAFGGFFVFPSGFEVALFGAAPDHDGAAHGAAEAGEVGGEVGGLLPDSVVGGGEVEALGFDEEPVEADDLEAVVAGDGAGLFGFGDGEFAGVFFESEGGDLDGVVSGVGDVFAGVLEGPVLVGFVADGEFHEGRNF
jgi:hypothetical protein